MNIKLTESIDARNARIAKQQRNVKVTLGVQVSMQGNPSDADVAAWGLVVQQQLARHGVDTEVEVYDAHETYVELRVWVSGTPAAVRDAADMCQMIAACAAMFVQLTDATEHHVQQVVDACKTYNLDVDMYHDGDAQGIAYMYTAPQLRAVMQALLA